MPSPAGKSQAPRFQTFGKYLLLERIAVGGMAEVYLAKTLSPDGKVGDLIAIKRILPSLAADSEFIRMFLDEAKIASQLDHPGVVKILELGRIGVSHYLAMEFVWGKDLLHLVRRARLLGAKVDGPFIAAVGAAMCEALAYAHEKTDRRGVPLQLVHRDISPQNVLVSFDGKVRLIDFGIAKAQSRSTHTQHGVLKGKVGYMSPEQVQGRPIDHRSDIFAVGTCLYELATQKSLFARENNFEAMESVRDARVPPLEEARPDLDPELVQVLMGALRRDRDERWQSARELKEVLERYLSLKAPGYGHADVAAWLRDAFRKELSKERVRLEALDLVGRRQLTPADGPRRISVTDLEIPIADVGPPDWDDPDDGETLVFGDLVEDEPESPEEDEEGPTEIFYSSGEARESTGKQRVGGGPGSKPGSSAPVKLDADGDLALSPREIDSAILKKLLPDDPRSHSSREPTARQRLHGREAAPSSGASWGTWLARIALGLFFLAIGAGLTYWTMSTETHSSVEVRTVPRTTALVLVDGVRRGQAPLRLEYVTPGRHVITVVADGFEDQSRTVEVTPNSSLFVEFTLDPLERPTAGD